MHETLSRRWSSISLRSKITGVTVLMLTLGLLVSGIGTMAMLKQYVVTQVDTRLQVDTQTALSGYSSSVFSQGDTEGVASDYFVALYDQDGDLITRTWQERDHSELPVVGMPLDLKRVSQLDGQIQTLWDAAHDTEFHAIMVPVVISPTGTYGTLVMAVSLRPTENTMATYLTIFLGFGAGVVLIGAMLTRVLVTTTFVPLREAEQTAAAIADGDFSQRLGGATPNTEVGRLNRSLNIMLSRIDRAFKDRARTIDQMRRFVGDASHELRTPLVSVRGYAELYRMGALQTPDDVAQAMERIEKEAIRMGGLVEDLLELARLDETKPLALTPVDLVPLARDAALDAMASSPGRQVTVLTPPPVIGPLDAGLDRDLHLDDDSGEILPHENDASESMTTGAITRPSGTGTPTGAIAFAGATLARLRTRKPRRGAAVLPDAEVTVLPIEPQLPPIVMAEENKIRQVITNLMGNAMRFTASDSPIELEIMVDPRTQRASIAVIDHGEGIAPQIREKIFQRFWRADSSRARETGGSGLGLAIVAAIIASHNGSVDVVDTPGGGATFRVSLPLAGTPSAPQHAQPVIP
ncbi:MAG: HAMP domain-containing histidine kinase [Cryobacterium sp.]|uniref:sensor histidine kinase n=1 Tax=unclassified Cryobacterium TaxID=2649013 RepID=UPI0018C92E69|nr:MULTISPECIES: HAMP domain-containing sensor histidine kinase [unclassified Cryobacterium]MCY7404283.1 HAMP domain-containing histidine kinase [Cryobacterium sp.]MEC5155018.1 two-component system OmpR family sensor kinase [Cryobacterium sp. CAN_C3]